MSRSGNHTNPNRVLTYQASGPTAAGKFHVTYLTPGCAVLTSACECSTRQQATEEAERLNQEQVVRELAIQRERELCGLRRIRGPEVC